MFLVLRGIQASPLQAPANVPGSDDSSCTYKDSYDFVLNLITGTVCAAGSFAKHAAYKFCPASWAAKVSLLVLPSRGKPGNLNAGCSFPGISDNAIGYGDPEVEGYLSRLFRVKLSPLMEEPLGGNFSLLES